MRFVAKALLLLFCLKAWGGLPHAVVCQALLTGLRDVPETSRHTPLYSIRLLQELLRRSPNFHAKYELPRVSGYAYGQDYFGFLNRPNSLLLNRINKWRFGYINTFRVLEESSPATPFKPFVHPFAALLSRLKQLEDDSTGYTPDLALVGIELRGREDVQRYLDILKGDLSSINSDVSAELRRRFPWWRSANWFHYGFQAALISWGLGSLDPKKSIPIYIMVQYFELSRWFIPFHNQQRGMFRQLDFIKKCLDNPCENGEISVLSSGETVDKNFHQAIMSTDPSEEPSTEMTMLDSAVSHLHPADYLLGAMGTAVGLSAPILAPEGGEIDLTRTVYYDSIFYVEPNSNEPVWLIYYRAFKRPPKPRPLEEPVKQPAAAKAAVVPGAVPEPGR